MQDFKQPRKLNKKNYLNNIHNLKKPFIIYKTNKGFDLFTDFSKKIILNNQNIRQFLKQKYKIKKKNKKTDLFIGFFGYELLNNLIGVKIHRQKSINFPKGIFYKPETKINLKENLIYKPQLMHKTDRNFKISINQKSYSKIFDNFKKKIKSGETYQIKICTKYKNKSQIDPLDFFCRLTKTNLAPESFMIKDKDYSIISCSPENLINKKGSSISTKPIAGTLRKNKKINKRKALSFLEIILKKQKNTT